MLIVLNQWGFFVFLLIKRKNEFHKCIGFDFKLMCLFPNVDLDCVCGH